MLQIVVGAATARQNVMDMQDRISSRGGDTKPRAFDAGLRKQAYRGTIACWQWSRDCNFSRGQVRAYRRSNATQPHRETQSYRKTGCIQAQPEKTSSRQSVISWDCYSVFSSSANSSKRWHLASVRNRFTAGAQLSSLCKARSRIKPSFKSDSTNTA